MKIKSRCSVLFLPLLLLLGALCGATANAATPTLSITNLVAGQRLSNAVFTVEGKATGSISNVLYSLNSAAWTNATTTNSGTQWSAQINLTPGTNFFSAYAIGNGGTHSAASTVKFVYVLMTTLTVLTNGTGSISPNYDNVPLQIGANYSMTATSSIAGFGLQTWTDGSNHIITNSATLKFVMASNLTFVANMGDVTKPVVAVTSLVTNAGGIPTSLIFSGTASDNIAVTNVQYSLNNAAWTNAATGNNWSNWTAQVTLMPGTNTLFIQAVDSSGNFSATSSPKVFCAITDILTVHTNGSGSITPNYNGAQLLLGVNYSMTAKSSKLGFGLVSWTDRDGNFITHNATLKFTMATNLLFTANMGEITAPKVTLSSATTNADGIPNDYVVRGTASDNMGVTNVFYQLNNGAWLAAITTNHWKNWKANVSLAPGANTFSVYAVDGNYNTSATVTAQITYNSTPSSLSGFSGIGYDANSVSHFKIAFGGSTFSQFAQNTNSFNGVGTYTYSGSGGGGTLKLKYTGPPSATNEGSQTLGLLFFAPQLAYFTNSHTKSTGYLQFTPAPKRSLTDVSGQLLWTVGSQGDGNGLLFHNGKFTSSSLLSSATNGGSYAYTQYSRSGSLLKLTDTNGTSYVLADFATTNYGAFYSEDYDLSGNTNGTDTGRFLIGAQKPGGNAPLMVTDSSFEIFSTGETINESFGTDTYSQDTLSTNYDNDVGSYNYSRPDTNIGQLDLTVTEPPNLAGSNNFARLVFINGNAGIFTNHDSTISSFVMTTATNYTPASITNFSLPIGFYASIQFTNDGSFIYTVYNNPFFPNTYSGNYTYKIFSPVTAMVQLSYLYSNTVVGIDWLQLNFNATNSGNVFWNQFDSNTNFTDIYDSGGPFSLY